jgi:hypothetical protein
MGRVRMRRVVAVGVLEAGCMLVRGDHVHFGCGNAASAHFVHFKARSYVERGSRFRERFERDAGVHKGTEQHVAAYSRKTLKICSPHRR